jgi:TPR repeat protein
VAADHGDPIALMYFASIGGFGVGQHDERELEAFQTAADAGNLDAMRMLALLMAGVNESDGRARLEKVAAAGVADAMMDLATIYSEGRGVAKDEVQAAQWIAKAAVAGRYDAMIQLANRCEAAFAANKDQNAHDLAVAWMRQAATLESTESPGPARKWLTDRGLNP